MWGGIKGFDVVFFGFLLFFGLGSFLFFVIFDLLLVVLSNICLDFVRSLFVWWDCFLPLDRTAID